jgi:anti-anti-sigma factor
MGPSFTCAIAGEGERTLVVLVGEIDIASVPNVVSVAGEAVRRQRPIVVDLGGVSFIDGSGLDSLMAFAQTAADGGCAVSFVHRPPVVNRILDLTNESLSVS